MSNKLLNKTYNFYRYECCMPYTISFILVLVIYSLDFFSSTKIMWASVLSFIIITGYYFYNLAIYMRKKLVSEDPDFFIGILTVKILIWGCLLMFLCLLK